MANTIGKTLVVPFTELTGFQTTLNALIETEEASGWMLANTNYAIMQDEDGDQGGFVLVSLQHTNYVTNVGTLTADASGRARMATDYFNSATVVSKFATDCLDAATLASLIATGAMSNANLLDFIPADAFDDTLLAQIWGTDAVTTALILDAFKDDAFTAATMAKFDTGCLTTANLLDMIPANAFTTALLTSIVNTDAIDKTVADQILDRTAVKVTNHLQVNVLATALTDAAVTQTVDGPVLPANSLVMAAYVNNVIEFDDGAAGTMAVEIGTAGTPALFMASVDIESGQGTGFKSLVGSKVGPSDLQGAGAIKAKFTGSANMNTYNTGSVDIEVEYLQIV